VKHPLVAPFVAEFLDQCGNEVRDSIPGMDRRLGMQLVDRLDDRRGILDASAVGCDHQRNDRQFCVFFEFGLTGGIAQDPLVRDGLVAEIGTHLDRIGRHLGADDAVAVSHG